MLSARWVCALESSSYSCVNSLLYIFIIQKCNRHFSLGFLCMEFQTWQNSQSQIYWQIYCKCMGKLKYMGKYIVNACADSNTWATLTSQCMVKMPRECMISSKIMLMHYQILKCKCIVKCECIISIIKCKYIVKCKHINSIYLSNANSLSSMKESSAIFKSWPHGLRLVLWSLISVISACVGWTLWGPGGH